MAHTTSASARLKTNIPQKALTFENWLWHRESDIAKSMFRISSRKSKAETPPYSTYLGGFFYPHCIANASILGGAVRGAITARRFLWPGTANPHSVRPFFVAVNFGRVKPTILPEEAYHAA